MKNKKLLSLALAAALVSGTAFGATSCGKKFADDDNALEIYVAKLGYGDEWLQKAAKRFAEFDYVKETYPNFQYKIFANDEYTFGQEQVKSGATTYDLLFCSSFSLSTVEVAGPNGEKSVLEDLTSLFNSKIPDYANGGYEKNDAGEEWTYGEKLKKNNPGKFAGLAYKEDENGETVETFPITPHCFRHSFATICYEAGLDPRQAAGLLGDTPDVVEAVYTHLRQDRRQTAAEKLTAYFDEKPVSQL